ncbi:MAG: YdcF family protein, partial [Candidatus Ryanbacteria bacterium]|nr:YdcF family protein [Candidatus Ryanbacteria bacterium]
LYKEGYCKYILISGGKNKTLRNTTEAQWHRNNLVKKGVPENAILLEERASNSLENVIFSKAVIKRFWGRLPKRLIVVCKAFHGRRAIMTLRKNFSKNTEYILQLVQTKNHKTRNWWQKTKNRDHIIDEIRKIGEYTLKGDITYE